MATTSIWRIKGKLGSVLEYIENPEKTVTHSPNPADEDASIRDVLEYVTRDSATDHSQLVSTINCSVKTAVKDMNETKQRFGKPGGTVAYHGYQSFKEGEVTPKLAHMIGVRLAEELWGDRYEVVVATHIDKDSHIHNHFLINTVSFIDGKKYFRSSGDYKRMREVSDRLCRQYRLSVVKHPQGRGKHYGEWAAEKKGRPTYRSMIRRDIDDAIRKSLTEREFFQFLKEKGYEFKLYNSKGGELERPSLRPSGSERYFRFDGLGDDYRMDEIRERILEKITRIEPFPEDDRKAIRRYRMDHPPHTKHKGIAALYYHYCYELHIIVNYPASVKRVSFFMREDLLKLDRLDEQVRFLAKNSIETMDDLNGYREKAGGRIRLLEWERQVQRNLLKQEVRKDNLPGQDELREKIAGISGEIRQLKNDLKICDSVEKRSAQIGSELETLKEMEKGEERDGLLRRRGGTGRKNVSKRS